MELVVVLMVILFIYALFERFFHQRNLNKIPIRIMVNGTRGKTSTTRMLYASLKQSGLTVMAKTTGSDAVLILPDGTEQNYRKPKRIITLYEQIPFVRMAVKNKVDVIVVECMALQRESQLAMAQYYICPTHMILTNAYVDHIEEIGATTEETIDTLSLSIPKNCVVVSGEERFKPYAKIYVPLLELPAYFSADKFTYPVVESNCKAVLTLCNYLGINEIIALEGMYNSMPDIGMQGPFVLNDKHVFHNVFAANDVISAQEQIQKTKRLNAKTIIVYNHRQDRLYRLKQYYTLFTDLSKQGATIYIMGDYNKKVTSVLRKKCNANVQSFPKEIQLFLTSLPNECIDIYGIGNIKGPGEQLIKTLQILTTKGDVA